MASSLYREEALQHAGQKHLGEPGLNPLRFLLSLTLVLVLLVALSIAFIGSARFSKKQEVTGHIDTTTNSLIASEFGHLEMLRVQEGQQVQVGDELGHLISGRGADDAATIASQQIHTRGQT